MVLTIVLLVGNKQTNIQKEIKVEDSFVCLCVGTCAKPWKRKWQASWQTRRHHCFVNYFLVAGEANNFSVTVLLHFLNDLEIIK